MQLETPVLSSPRLSASARALNDLSTESRISSPVAPRPEVIHDEPRSIGPMPADSVVSLLPLPVGEGRGEGGPAVPSHGAVEAGILPPPLPAPSADAERIRSQRLAIIRTVDAYVAQHSCSISAACVALHISHATYSRHAAQLAAGGPDALLPGYDRCGRKTVIDTLIDPADREWIITRLRALNGRTHHAQTAATILARQPDCPAALAAYLQHARRIPKSLLRAAHITPEIRAQFCGPKSYQYAGSVSLRDMTEIMPDGSRIPIRPGDWWEMDDMSINTPYWYEIPPDSQERASTTPGIGLGRQGLYALDVASGKWLGHLLVGRPRDSYRAEDILRFIRSLLETHGKPRRGLRLERGSWYSHAVRGTPLPHPQRNDDDIIVSGLRSIGLEISYAYTSRAKGMIETSFRYLQDLMAAEDIPTIGRWRGEGERSTTQLLRAKAGTIHPQAAGFPHIDVASTIVTRAETLANTTTKRGRLAHGIPDERWLASITLAPLAPLTPADRAAFLPDRGEIRIRRGSITLQRDNQIYTYTAPDLFPRLGEGYRLLAAFDPSEPALGCAVWNAETGSANTDAWPIGQYLGIAQHIPLSPQFGRADDSPARDARKTATNFHRTAYAALVPGRATPTTSTLRDGRGNAIHITRDPGASNVAAPQGARVPSPGAPRANPQAAKPLPLSPEGEGRGEGGSAVAAPLGAAPSEIETLDISSPTSETIDTVEQINL